MIRRICAVMILVAAFASCSSPGMVNVNEIAPLAEPVMDRHDEWLMQMENVSESDRARWLRSTEILRTVFEKAREGQTQ